MAGKFSFVTLWDGDKVTDHITTTREKGDAMLRVLHGIDEPKNAEQSAFLLRVKSIHPDLQTDAPDASSAQNEYWDGLDKTTAQTDAVMVDTSSLTHEGVLQGMNEALPRGDR